MNESSARDSVAASEWVYRSAVEWLSLLERRELSSVEVVGAHLERIERINEGLNAVVQLNPHALSQAEHSDRLRSRGEVGPLHGLPFTIKDWIEASGLSRGPEIKGAGAAPAKRDATVVARLRRAGAVLLGVSKAGAEAGIYPEAHNPYDPARTPGASSSGEAVIIAAGGSPVGLGSDSGGSLRWPAHCCGVTALKPTQGLVPNTGHFPRIVALADPRTTIGPMARSVSDLELVLPLLAGCDGEDASVVPMPVGRSLGTRLGSLTVAWYDSVPGASLSPDVRRVLSEVVAVLSDRGAAIVQARPEHLEDALGITRVYWARTRSTSSRRWQPTPGLRTVPSVIAEDIERSLFEWDRLRRAMTRLMVSHDVLVCPVACEVAPARAGWSESDFLFTLPFSLSGNPVVVVRAGTSNEGLPIGVQIVARPWQEAVAIAVARQIEQSLGGWQPPKLSPDVSVRA